MWRKGDGTLGQKGTGEVREKEKRGAGGAIFCHRKRAKNQEICGIWVGKIYKLYGMETGNLRYGKGKFGPLRPPPPSLWCPKKLHHSPVILTSAQPPPCRDVPTTPTVACSNSEDAGDVGEGGGLSVFRKAFNG